MSLSLVEKLALTGAFLGLVAMAVGTDEDPGLVAESAEVLTAKAKDHASTAAATTPVAVPSASSVAPSVIEAPPARDSNEGAGAQPAMPQPSDEPASPPDEPGQLDMRKVIAGT